VAPVTCEAGLDGVFPAHYCIFRSSWLLLFFCFTFVH